MEPHPGVPHSFPNLSEPCCPDGGSRLSAWELFRPEEFQGRGGPKSHLLKRASS